RHHLLYEAGFRSRGEAAHRRTRRRCDLRFRGRANVHAGIELHPAARDDGVIRTVRRESAADRPVDPEYEGLAVPDATYTGSLLRGPPGAALESRRNFSVDGIRKTEGCHRSNVSSGPGGTGAPRSGVTSDRGQGAADSERRMKAAATSRGNEL